jgi:hypothetical protein
VDIHIDVKQHLSGALIALLWVFRSATFGANEVPVGVFLVIALLGVWIIGTAYEASP